MRPNEMTAPDDLTQRAREVAELAAKATLGEWKHDGNGRVGVVDFDQWGLTICISGIRQASPQDKRDMEFVASCREMASLIADQSAEIERLTKLVSELSDALGKAQARPVGPDRCPFTGRPFWGNIEREGEWIATYGGPYDTYTIPERTDDDPDYCFYRFDQDGGYWVDGMESIGMRLVDDQLYTCEEDPAEMAKRIAELERAMSDALPGRYYMDPPDGGGVCLDEQFRRMGKDAARYRWLRDQTHDDGCLIVMKQKYIPRFVSVAKAIDEYIDAALSAVQAKEKGE